MPGAATSTPLPSSSSEEPELRPSRRGRGRGLHLRGIGQSLGLLTLGTIAALLLLEVGFRLMPARQLPDPTADRPKHYLVPDEFPYRPNFHLLGEKAPGTFRVVAIGDSFTFGQRVQLDDAYPARIERILNLDAKDGTRAEVINAGVQGFSAADELEILKKALAIAKPDLIIWQITLNDPELEPYRVRFNYLDEHGRVRLTSPIFSYWKSLRFIVERILNSKTHRDYVSYYFDLFNGQQTWGRFTEALKAARNLTTEANVPLLTAVFPLFSHPLDDSYPFEPLHEKLDAFLKSEQIPFIDLRRVFQGQDPHRLQVEPGQDSHPNEIAHRIAADTLFSVLVRRKMVPKELRSKRMEAVR